MAKGMKSHGSPMSRMTKGKGPAGAGEVGGKGPGKAAAKYAKGSDKMSPFAKGGMKPC